MKILISTFGPNPENTLAAMRALSYDILVLVLSEEDLQTAGYKLVLKAEESSRGKIDHIFVDKYDFQDCFRRIVDYVVMSSGEIRKGKKVENLISINISGGSKIMGDAALLASFQTGIGAYHSEKARTIRFPIIEGVTLRDRLSSSQVTVLREIGKRDTIDDISRKIGPNLTEETIRKSLRKLRKMGIIETIVTEGRVFAELTDAGIFVLETINRLGTTGKSGS